MQGRKNWLGYLAIGLGVAALIVSLGGRMSGPWGSMQMPEGRGGRNRPAAVPQQPAAQAPAAPADPSTGQGAAVPRQGFDRGANQGQGTGPAGRALQRGEERSPFGHLLGLVPLLGGLLVIGLGLKLFVGPGRRGGPRGGQAVHVEQNWQQAPAVPTAVAPQAQPAPSQPSQTPPAAPHTGETTRMYDF